MSTAAETLFLLDGDNTLLDNDSIIPDLGEHLGQEFGHENRTAIRKYTKH